MEFQWIRMSKCFKIEKTSYIVRIFKAHVKHLLQKQFRRLQLIQEISKNFNNFTFLGQFFLEMFRSQNIENEFNDN